MITVTAYRYDRPQSGGRFGNDLQESLSEVVGVDFHDVCGLLRGRRLPAELTRNVGREPATPEEAADIIEIDADHL